MLFQTFLFKSHLAEGEQILFVLHKHWSEIIKISAQTIFFGFATPWILWAIFPVIIWVSIIWSIIAFIKFFYEIIDWYFDAWLVTNAGIIDVEWKGIFHRTSSRVSYGEINEIAWEIKGFLGTIFRFGIIVVQTTVGSQITLENANKPKRAELIINEIKEKILHAQKMSDAATLQEILADLIQKHIAENGLPVKKES